MNSARILAQCIGWIGMRDSPGGSQTKQDARQQRDGSREQENAQVGSGVQRGVSRRRPQSVE